MDAVSPILVERAREPQGLKNMWVLSLVVHGVATALLLLLPAPSIEDDPLKNTMTISLNGAIGVRNGGMTSMASRTAEAAPNPEKAPEAPPASKPPEMVLPTKREPLKPAPSKAPTDAKARPMPKAAVATQGDARVETHTTGLGFGLATGGGGGTSGTLDVSDFCCPDYISTMQTLIIRNWDQNQSVAGQSRIQFTVQRDGRLTDIRMVQSSGYFALDRAAQSAIAMTRLPPLPAQFPNQTLTVLFNFNYQR